MPNYLDYDIRCTQFGFSVDIMRQFQGERYSRPTPFKQQKDPSFRAIVEQDTTYNGDLSE